jgi:gamma-glutamyltranspeptidase
MSVVIVLEGVGSDRFAVAHHPEHAARAVAGTSTAPSAFTAGLSRFARICW